MLAIFLATIGESFVPFFILVWAVLLNFSFRVIPFLQIGVVATIESALPRDLCLPRFTLSLRHLVKRNCSAFSLFIIEKHPSYL